MVFGYHFKVVKLLSGILRRVVSVNSFSTAVLCAVLPGELNFLVHPSEFLENQGPGKLRQPPLIEKYFCVL